MAGLDLSPSEVAAVRCLLACDVTDHPDFPVRSRNLLTALRRLVPCDRIALLVRDEAGHVELRVDHPPGPATHSVHDRLLVICSLESRRVAQLQLDRYGRRFEPRYAELMHMLQPALVRQVLPSASPAEPVRGLSDLSVAELQVLRLVSGGATNQDVADQLSVSEATVRKHLEHVYRKLGVTNRTAASAVVRAAAPA